MEKIKTGSLVCYNACGMKYKTLGLVLEIDKPRNCYGKRDTGILIQWCIVDKYMPRQDFRNGGWPSDPIQSGSLCWHALGDWFEEVK